MAYAYGRPNLRDVPEPETLITIMLNIPKPPGGCVQNRLAEPLPANSMEQHVGQDQGGEQSCTEPRHASPAATNARLRSLLPTETRLTNRP